MRITKKHAEMTYQLYLLRKHVRMFLSVRQSGSISGMRVIEWKYLERSKQLNTYYILESIGQGQYGIVERVIRAEDGAVFALKKTFQPALQRGIRMPSWRAKDGLITEISCLLALSKCKYVLDIVEWCEKANGKKALMVIEYAPFHLGQIIEVQKRNNSVEEYEIRKITLMILSALECCHLNGIIHRDIKPNNFLFTTNGEIRLSDFGQAWKMGQNNELLTTEVGHTWYKAPELLYGSENYGCEIDIWALGCVIVEMYVGRPLFKGESDIDQLSQIFNVFGTPKDSDWPTVAALPDYGKIEFYSCNGLDLAEVVGEKCSKNGLNLIGRMLSLDPMKRISASEALKHPFFDGNVSHEIKSLPNISNEVPHGIQKGIAKPLSRCDDDELTWDMF